MGKILEKSGKSQVICQSGKVGEYSNKVLTSFVASESIVSQ